MCLFFAVFSVFAVCAQEGKKTEFSSWSQIVEKMEVHLNNAYELYSQGKSREAYNEVNAAYFRYYEAKGMEKITMAYLSGARKTAVENAFYEYRKMVRNDKDADEVRRHKDALISMLNKDAADLDGSSKKDKNRGSSGVATFIAGFVLILREGLEAILVIAAIIAYLVKTGKKKYVFAVYMGAAAGVLISVVLAMLFNFFAGTQSGVAREIFEGVGMFLAVVVLFYVSNWMISKSETEAWEKYIRKKVEVSVSTGNKWVLIFTAFIAVAREGAELILFFQGIPMNGAADQRAVVLAIILSALVLTAVFIVFRFLTVKLPLKPFFIVTSILMYLMCFSFTGKGVSELQAAGVINKTSIAWMKGFEWDFFGVYATYESLVPQLVVLLLTIICAVWYICKNKKAFAELEQEKNMHKN